MIRPTALALALLVLAASDVPPSRSPGWVIKGTAAGEHLGASMACAGDVNGDGLPDVVVGSPGYDDGKGRVDLFLGAKDGLASVPSWTLLGSQLRGNVSQFGQSVAGAGDVNGDGLADIIVGSPNNDDGRAFIFHGDRSLKGLSDAPEILISSLPGTQFGYSVASAGDVNGDGFSDVIIGAPYAGIGFVPTGGAFLWMRLSKDEPMKLAWESYGGSIPGFYSDLYGWSVSSAGDVNGDGCDDFLVGAPDVTSNDDGISTTHAFLFLGSAHEVSRSPAWVGAPGPSDLGYGNCVARAGNLNGDRYSDFVIGGNGHAYIYYGRTTGLDTMAPAIVLNGETPGDGFGASVASLGDMDADGFDEVGIGSVTANRLYVYGGGASGIAAVPAWTADGNANDVAGDDDPPSCFGSVVAGGGDLNGDMSADVLVAAPGYSATQAHQGRACVIYGDNLRGIGNPRQCRLDGATAIAPGGSTLETGVVLSGKIMFPAGGRLEVEVQPAGEAFQNLPTKQSGPVGRGAVASVTVPCETDRAWHWQARFMDADNRPGEWVSFGRMPEDPSEIDFRTRSNAAPTGSAAGQFASGRALAVGAEIGSRDSLSLRVAGADSHDDDISLELEIRPLGEAFANAATLISPMRTPGSIEVTEQLGAGSYHWQWRLVDAIGAAGAWTPYGGNPESLADFVVVEGGSNGTSCSAGGAGWATLLPAAALLLLIRRMR